MTIKNRLLTLFTAAMIFILIPFMSLAVSAGDDTSATYIITMVIGTAVVARKRVK